MKAQSNANIVEEIRVSLSENCMGMDAIFYANISFSR